jgi:predicted nucleic acid-binding protein
MSVLLDVNMLLACGWQTHLRHAEAVAWLDGVSEFYRCPLVELGFLRVSIGPAFRTPFEDAATVLADIKRRTGAKAMADDFDMAGLPSLVSHAEVTDAYLVELARSKSLQLATLDNALCERPWAAGVAVVPLPKIVNPAAGRL